MKEIQDIVYAYDKAVKAGKHTALATVVQLEGSAYRRPGARMLVTDDGQLTGAISGGCLEGDALRKARLAMVQQEPMLVTYDTTDDDDAKLGVGLGCNGIIQILIEPIDPALPENPIELLKNYLDKRQKAVLVTLFSLQDKKAKQAGTRLLLTENKQSIGSYPENDLQNQLLADAAETLQTHTSQLKDYQQESIKMTAFLEFLKPCVSLVIIGAGNDAIPLAQMATVLGWQVTVADGRANYATHARFPMAKQVLVAKPDELLPQLEIDAQTVVVLMTHNYNYDFAMLRQLLPLPIPYVGALGPKKKLQRMLGELKEDGFEPDKQQLQKVFGPTGIDLGAETSEEIALSIVAEIKAVLAGKQVNSLRDNAGAIHQRDKKPQTAADVALGAYRSCSF